MKTTLSKRLLAVAGFVTPGSRVADIGTDHAFVPIYLMEHKIVPSALAMDIGKGPLLAAEEHIKEHGLEKYITARQSDGVLALQDGEADSVIIAGMGGALVIKISFCSHSPRWKKCAISFMKVDIISQRRKWSLRMANIIR